MVVPCQKFQARSEDDILAASLLRRVFENIFKRIAEETGEGVPKGGTMAQAVIALDRLSCSGKPSRNSFERGYGETALSSASKNVPRSIFWPSLPLEKVDRSPSGHRGSRRTFPSHNRPETRRRTTSASFAEFRSSMESGFETDFDHFLKMSE